MDGCGEIGTLLLLLVGMENDVPAMENGVAIPQKIKHRITISSSNSISGVYSKKVKVELEQIFARQCS